MMTDGLLTDPDAIRARTEGLAEVGVDELFLWPQVADLEQVRRLADAVRG